MQMQGGMLQNMIMEEAIKDKTAQVQAEHEAQQQIDSAQFNEDAQQEEVENSDSDFDDDDDVMQSLREQRIAMMKLEQAEHMKNMQNGHGRYTEITEEQFLPEVTKTQFVVVHFYHADFERCKIMDHHLDIICKKHTETKFVKINSEKCPFFVAKLQIQMLPTVICFMDGVAFDRVTGFEELGGVDEFPTLLLTRKLVKTGCIKALTKKEKGDMKIRRKGEKESDDDDSDN